MGTPAEELSRYDPGDDMQRRLRYQAAYGALVCLQLLEDSAELLEVFCEHHEDILARKSVGKWVGFQVKTREVHLGPFKADESAVVSSMQRFVQLDLDFPEQFEHFVLVANCDFWQGERNGKNLPYMLAGC
jgi:hypothetical protein